MKGVLRDRSSSFFKHKRGEPAGSSRFKAKNANLFNNFYEKHSDDCENPSKSLLEDEGVRNGFDSVSIFFTYPY